MRQARKTAAPGSERTGENPMRERIIGAAFRAFMENGYTATSTLEIATRAQVSKRDLYANFGSKHAIVVACVEHRAARMRLAPDLPAPRTPQTLAATLTTLGATVILEVCQPEVTAMFRLAIAEAEHSSEVAQTLDKARSVNRRAVASLLAEAQASGILGDGDPERMMEQFFALQWGDLLLSRLLGVAGAPTRTEIDDRARAATEAFLKLHGCVREKGPPA